MTTKQFWTIQNHPNSLVATAFKAIYFPNTSLRDHKPKPNHSWIRKNITQPQCKDLLQGHWLIGSGNHIPLTHPDWFYSSDQRLRDNNSLEGTVADLIDGNTKSWKGELLNNLYPCSTYKEIMKLSIPKTEGNEDKLIWKHSHSAHYKVRNAYYLIQQKQCPTNRIDQRTNGIPQNVWKLLWKVKLPLKIPIFIWKIMRDCSPVFATLKRRGIPVTNKCLLCEEEEEETIDHIFLRCHFVRVVWHGSILEIRTTSLMPNTARKWLSNCILNNRSREQNHIYFLQACFTIIWQIWNHKNQVLHQGKSPNPIEVILTSQSLIFRYQEAYQQNEAPQQKPSRNNHQYLTNQNLHIIIRLAAHRSRKTRRSGFAYEALNLDGCVLFTGGASSGRKPHFLAIQDALIEAMLKKKELGFNRILTLNNSKRLVQRCNLLGTPSWQEQCLTSDLLRLQQKGMTIHSFFVPRIMISHVIELVAITTSFPVHFCRLLPYPS